MGKHLTEHQKQNICRDYKNGAGPLQLSLEYGVAANTIWRVLVDNNVPRDYREKRKDG